MRRSRPSVRRRAPPGSPGSPPDRRRMPAVRRRSAGRKRSGSRQAGATREHRLVNPVALRVRLRAQRADEPGPHVAPRFGFPPSLHSSPPRPLCPQAATRGAIVGPRPGGPGSSGDTRPADVTGGSLVMVGRFRPRRTSRGRPWCARGNSPLVVVPTRQARSSDGVIVRSRPGGPGSSRRNSTRRRGRRVAVDGRSFPTPQDIAGSSRVRVKKQPSGRGPDPASRVVRRSSTLGRVAGAGRSPDPDGRADPSGRVARNAPIRVVLEPVGPHERVWYVRPLGPFRVRLSRE